MMKDSTRADSSRPNHHFKDLADKAQSSSDK